MIWPCTRDRCRVDSNIFCVKSGLFAPGDHDLTYFYGKGRKAGDRYGTQISRNAKKVLMSFLDESGRLQHVSMVLADFNAEN